jgi:hypothetical protein
MWLRVAQLPLAKGTHHFNMYVGGGHQPPLADNAIRTARLFFHSDMVQSLTMQCLIHHTQHRRHALDAIEWLQEE